ncbi:DUF488 domain-containing protein [bacterium]|nr:DUF488 domain-containing protein [bacterium]
MVAPADALTVYTVGHSNHTVERLLELLAAHDIAVVADVRSSPYSKYAGQFNRAPLEAAVAQAGLAYAYLGEALGGMPNVPGFYDADGHVRYDLIAASDRFRDGLARLLEIARERRVALLCSEEDPGDCHRHLLLARVLCERGVTVLHLRGDGSVTSDADLTAAAEFERTGGQQSLFEDDGERPWRSTRSATPRSQPRSSSSV